jgi:BsuBI/PstI restriction endonuclease domain/BsuBI/PstI restriction endonuclease HTH domain
VTLPALLPDRASYKMRLEEILPASVTGTTASCNEIAGAAAFTLMYVGAVEGERQVRPLMVTQMDSQTAMLRDDEDRLAWHRAAERSAKAIETLTESWGISSRQPWYAADSREGIRDETFRVWAANGALRVDESISTTSSKPRYSFTREFAALLDPALDGAALRAAIDKWQQGHLTPTARLRSQRQREQERRRSAVIVHLPDGGFRELLVGPSSDILKGVVEEFTRYLSQPTVLFVSQPGEKVNVVDSELLRALRLPIDQQRLLPDALIVDLDPGRDEFWFVEVVATDGPVDDDRKARLLGWAVSSGLDPGRCRFLTAFASRTSREAKKALPTLARGTFAWFLTEPDALLFWGDPIHLTSLTTDDAP